MSTSSVPLWGRAYELILSIGSKDSGDSAKVTSSAWEPEALRIKFEVLESTNASPFWFADITVYNVNDADVLELLNSASGGKSLWLTLSAGYQKGNNLYSVIWSGPVLQVMYDQENVVDRVLRFNCIQAANQTFDQIFANFNTGIMSTQYQILTRMINQAGGQAPQQVSQLAQTMMSAKACPRGKTLFGGISKYVEQLALDNSLNTWIKENQRYVSELENPNLPLPVSLIYGPPLPPGAAVSNINSSVNASIIGIPKQTPFGAIFTVLLDPRLSVKLPPMVVQIQGLLSQYKLIYNQSLPNQWDSSGVYIVGQVRHYGDSRGNDWYTEVTGYQRNYGNNVLKTLYAMGS